MSSMIETVNLKKTFGDHEVLRGISQHIEKGEKVVIIGPSGSGKSTFLRCLNLLEEPTSGDVIFEGKKINAPKVDSVSAVTFAPYCVVGINAYSTGF